MAEVTVKQLASVVGAPVERLLEQIKDAGLSIDTPDSLISDADKMTLLGFLRGQHGKESGVDAGEKPHKIALKRKSVSEVKVRGSGRSTVSIEVRRKRSIPRPVVEEAQVDTADAAGQEVPAEITELEKLRADQARREEERESERQLKLERAAQRAQDQQAETSRLEEVKVKAEAEVRNKQAGQRDEKAAKPKEKVLTPDELQAQQSRDEKATSKKHKGEHKDKSTLYGRKELHVSSAQSGRRHKKKGKSARRSVASQDAKHGFERPVEAIVHDVTVPDTITR